MNRFKNPSPAGFVFSGKRLSLNSEAMGGGRIFIEFYKENGTVVFDLFFDRLADDDGEREFIYSTSSRFGVIYNYYGLDNSQYLDISQTVTQSLEQQSCMVLKGYVKVKEIHGTPIYSRIFYSAEYLCERDGKIVSHGTASDAVYNELEFERGWMIDKTEGVDHAQTARFLVSKFYIFYEKTVVTEPEK